MESLDNKIKKYYGKKNKNLIYTVLGFVGACFLGSFAYLINDSSKTQREFEKFLKNNPPTGTIAYTVGNKIRYLNANDLSGNLQTISTLQTTRNIEKLLWLNDEELIYIASENEDFPSDNIFKINKITGEETNIFSPYSSESSIFFGNIKEKENKIRRKNEETLSGLKEKQQKAKEEGKSFSYIFVPQVVKEFEIKNIGKDSNHQIYFLTNDLIYNINPISKKLIRLTIIPNINTDQTKNNPYILIDDNSLFNSPVKLTSNKGGYYLFEKDSDNPAWFIDY